MSFDILRARVIDRGLCVRCGACMGICPLSVVTADDRSYPVLRGECNGCGLCLAVCPGGEVDFPGISRRLFGTDYDPLDDHGRHRNLFIGWAADAAVRRAGSSGGVITALLAHLYQKGRIKGAIVCGPDPANACASAAYVATTVEEIVRGAQSRHAVIPVLRLLRAATALDGPFAVVALPCQTHALRKLETAAPDLASRIHLIIGLYCHFNLEPESVRDLLARHRINPGALERIEYRGGAWPGAIRAVYRDGRAVPLHRVGYKEAITFLLRLYSPRRCHWCIDPSNEFADIGVGDVWAMDYAGERAVEKSSLITQRTAPGLVALEEAAKDGALVLKSLLPEGYSRRHLNFFREKKHNAYIRLARRGRKGQPAPEYGFAPPEISFWDRFRERIYDLSLAPGRHGGLRRLLMRLYFSRGGAAFSGINDLRKRFFKKFRNY